MLNPADLPWASGGASATGHRQHHRPRRGDHANETPGLSLDFTFMNTTFKNDISRKGHQTTEDCEANCEANGYTRSFFLLWMRSKRSPPSISSYLGLERLRGALSGKKTKNSSLQCECIWISCLWSTWGPHTKKRLGPLRANPMSVTRLGCRNMLSTRTLKQKKHVQRAKETSKCLHSKLQPPTRPLPQSPTPGQFPRPGSSE